MDSRAFYSKRLIRKSFEELLREKPLNKITLTEVCKHAGINRSTFYRYYDGVTDWCEQIRREYNQGDSEFVEACAELSLHDRVMKVFEHMKDNLNLFRTLLTDDEQIAFMRKIFDQYLPKEESALRDVYEMFVLQGFMACVSRQLADEETHTVAEFASAVSQLLLRLRG